MLSLFVRVGPDTFDPTDLTGGPWRADAQHGGPPAALLAHVIESVALPDERVAKLGVELLKPVPLARLTSTAERSASSRRVAHATATLRSGEQIVARASALLLTASEVPEPDWRPARHCRTLDDARTIEAPSWISAGALAFHRDAVEHRVVEGGFETPGPAIEWLRLRQPVVAGTTSSPLERVAAASDIASGISAVYRSEAGVGLINADLTIALHRPLEGEWVGIDAVTEVGPDGIGLCTNRLFDVRGSIGTATQSLIGWSTR